MWKHFLIAFLTISMVCGSVAPVSAAKHEGTDPWAIAAEAIGVYAMYKSALTELLRIGNSAAAQVECRRQDIEENGTDGNLWEVRFVDDIMDTLINHGEYALKVNSLPFLWTVNDSKYFNACCYPTNYISINRALVRGLRYNRDELASVLAHEMTHGLRQHSAHNYAEAVARSMGMMLLGAESGGTDWRKLTGLVNYSIAKDVTMPSEVEADEGGFYLMASAGFNPGGAAASMVRMQRYLRYETQEMLEYDTQEKRNTEYSDHPETGDRVKNLSKLLTDYSAGHVTVKDLDVLIDGAVFLTASDSVEYQDDAVENAYLIAGGLAKAFHDFDTPAGWNFHTQGNGELSYLDGSPVYEKLRSVLIDKPLVQKMQSMVLSAYAKEGTERAAMKKAEADRSSAWEKIRTEEYSADEKFVKRLRYNCDMYADAGFSTLALFEMDRAFRCEHQDNLAESYVIRGRAKAVGGDFAGALSDAERGISMDEKNVLNYLNRADIYHMMGDMAHAMADSEAALKLDKKSAVAWMVAAQLRDECGQKETALEAYREYHKLQPKAEIPLEYLKEIDAKAAERIEKARKEKAEQERKEREEKKAEEEKAA